MIWYLLYPFRGTTEPPRLNPTHPLRKAFYRHGTATARHWLQWILIFVAFAVLVCYPLVFLYDNPTNGFRKLPHHVWTSAKAYEGPNHIKADVEVRQVWVHGNYMKALKKELLLEALQVQDHLVGTGSRSRGDDPCIQSALSGVPISVKDPRLFSWGFHSPLMFWNCSSTAIRSDDDIITTVNRQSQRQTYLNFTLRPTSVFAGKSFVKNQLVAADALVITIFDRTESGTQQRWEERAKALVSESSGKLSFYPSNGSVSRSQLYEFKFEPLSLNDDVLLTLAYLLTAFYLTISLRNQKAVKSRFGLVLAIFTEIGVSILASFTVCGIFKIDLAQIPRETYPFVVLILGLENMFRLTNAVFSLPPQSSATVRVATALGDVGHLSLAAAFQNLCVLWLLSKIVSPGVSAFCVYAAVALIFDFVFHLTFLVAVLSVDVRRIELQDSLDKAARHNVGAKLWTHERKPWHARLLVGKLPFSTRIAGSAAMICFVLALNWHFDYPARPASILKLVQWFTNSNSSTPLSFSSSPARINQPRTPAAWLRMQDYATAKEVVRFVKPGSHRFMARVYDPLLVVRSGANRYAETDQMHSFLKVIRDILSEHLFHFTISVVFAIAMITLLMNYLLYKEVPEDDLDVDAEERLFTFHTLPVTHSLDVTKLVNSRKGHFVSISLDRVVTIHIYDTRTANYSEHALATMAVNPPLWPIVACAIDDTGTWIAMCSESGSVAIWNIPMKGLSWICRLDIPHFPLCTFKFTTFSQDDVDTVVLLVVTPSGWLSEINPAQSALRPPQRLYDGRVLCCSLISRQWQHPRLIISTHEGDTIVASREGNGDWVSSPPAMKALTPDHRPRAVLNICALGLCVTLTPNEVTLRDSSTLDTIDTLHLGKIKLSSFRLLHSPRRSCHTCNGAAVHSVCIAYSDAADGSCKLHVFTAQGDETALMCLQSQANAVNGACRALRDATEVVHTVQSPGTWEATGVMSLVGLRRRPVKTADKYSGASVPSVSGSGKPALASQNAAPKYRIRSNNHAVLPNSSAQALSTPWEVWTISSSGELRTAPLCQEEGKSGDVASNTLFVSRPGPVTRLGKRSVALGVANRVQIITLGAESSIVEEDEYVDASATLKWRRRNPSKKTV